jgi:hypothetical protein
MKNLLPFAVTIWVCFVSMPWSAQAGYTHYFTWHQKPSPEQLKACIEEMRKIIEASKDVLGGPEGTGQPMVTDVEIVFNGLGDAAHEPFVFPGQAGFNFCKTAFKPYDAAVCACLMVARDHFPAALLEIGSDGEWTDWQEGKDLYVRVLNRPPQNPIGNEAPFQEIPWLGVVLAIVLVVIAGYVAFHVRADFTISHTTHGVQFSGRFPEVFRGPVKEFLETEFAPGRRFTVFGNRHSRGRMALRFRGSLSAGEQQRVRNYLTMLLH